MPFWASECLNQVLPVYKYKNIRKMNYENVEKIKFKI